MKAWLRVLAVITFVAGCADEPPHIRADTSAGDMPQVSVGALDADEAQGSDEEDICVLLPCDGPCSLACDYDALVEQYVPDGTCATFACDLTDGRTIMLDACNYPGD